MSAIAEIGALALVATTAKPVGAAAHEVAVAGPHRQFIRHAGEQCRGMSGTERGQRPVDADDRVSELGEGAGATSPRAGRPSAASRSKSPAQDGRACTRPGRTWVRSRRDTLRSARQDDPGQLRSRIFSMGVFGGHTSGRPTTRAASSDQLGELRAEIKNDDGLMGHGRNQKVTPL